MDIKNYMKNLDGMIYVHVGHNGNSKNVALNPDVFDDSLRHHYFREKE